MTRLEFMETLQRTLAGALGSRTVDGHMRYYQYYFDAQLSMGKSEADIVTELGNPRLLAKTIIEAAKREGRGDAMPGYDEVYEDGTTEAKGASGLRAHRMPGWLVAVIALVVIITVAGIVGSVISVMLPVLIPLICVVLLVRFFQRR